MAMLLSSSSSSCVPSFHISTIQNQNPSLSCNKPKKIGWVKENLKSCYHHLRRVRVIVCAKKEDRREEEQSSTPSWAKPGSDELPPWAREESQKESSTSFEFPFFAYLLASALTAIAAIGSIFEYVNQKPVFGVLDPDSTFYAPLLGFFVFTGIPSSAYLWFKSVQVANKEAEEQDRRDGYL